MFMQSPTEFDHHAEKIMKFIDSEVFSYFNLYMVIKMNYFKWTYQEYPKVRTCSDQLRSKEGIRSSE